MKQIAPRWPVLEAASSNLLVERKGIVPPMEADYVSICVLFPSALSP